MKHFFTLSVIVLCCNALLNAQVTLTKESHGFVSGQTQESWEVPYHSPGEAGEGIIWDFSAITPAESGTRIESAEIQDDYDRSNFKVSRNDGVTFFYNITERGNEYLGYNRNNLNISYTQPIRKTTYPQRYGTFFRGTFEGVRSLNGVKETAPVTGSYSTHADATGTIILPDGSSYPALRVYTTELAKSGGTAYETHKYLWYVQEVRFPVFVSIRTYRIERDRKELVDESSFFSPPKSSLLAPAGLTEMENGLQYSVSPNPFTGTIRLKYYLPQETRVSIDLYNLDGVKLTTLVNGELQNGFVTLDRDISAYTMSQGTYMLRIQSGEKTYTEKLVKK